MNNYRYGNPKKQSRFICCKCRTENKIAVGLQRNYRQREKGHIKDLFCLKCQDVTKNIEVRYCDRFDEMMEMAETVHKQFYEEVH